MAGSILDAAKTTLADAANVNVTPAFRDFPLVEYKEVTATLGMSSVPRWGHSSNFSQLFLASDSSSQHEMEASEARQDYMKGLLFVGGLILAIFMAWSVLLLVFKLSGCCCKTASRLGFLTGRPFSLDVEEDGISTKATIDHWADRSKRIRAVFFSSGVLLIVFAILFFVKGFSQVEETRSIADVSLDNVRILVDEASSLAEDLRDVGTSAIDLRDRLVVELGKDRLCPNDPNYLAQDEITRAIQDNAGAAIDMLEVLGEFATRDIKQMEDGLSIADSVIDDIDVVVETIAERQGVALVFVVPLTIFAALMIVGAVAAQQKVQHVCFEFTLSYVVMPVFVVFIVAAYLLCGGMALSASANADFCSGGTDMSPDSTIMFALQNAGLNQSTVEYEIARYYLHQCTKEALVDPFLFLRRHQAEIVTAQDIVEELSTSIEKIDIDTLSFNCGRDFEPLSSSLDTMMAILDRLDEAAASGLNLLSCERIVPIYAEIVYEGTCNYSVTGLTWMFSSLLIIATTGMIMIMFRSSYLNSILLAEMDPTDLDSELYDMNRLAAGGSNHERAMARGQAEAHAAALDLQMQEEDEWAKTVAVRQDTSDSGSVYTDGAELSIHQMERDHSAELANGTASPADYHPETKRSSSYVSPSGIRPTAPYEADVYDDLQHYSQHSSPQNPTYQGHIY